MANRNFFETLGRYRLKIEKDGKNVMDMPGILALPGLFLAPKMSIAGLIAAPLLGFNVHLESENGEAVDMENAVRQAADAVKESVAETTRTIREQMDKAWEAVSADNTEKVTEDAGENAKFPEANDVLNENAAEEVKAHENDDVPTIEVRPDDSAWT